MSFSESRLAKDLSMDIQGAKDIGGAFGKLPQVERLASFGENGAMESIGV